MHPSRYVVVLCTACLVACGGCDSNGSGDADSGDPNATPNANANVDPNNSSGQQLELPFAACAGDDAPIPLPAVACFGDVEEPDVDNPLAVIEHEYTEWEGIPAVYIRVTFNPAFVDNTFGANSMGWGDDGREFDKMVGSDHAQMVALDATGEVIVELKLDYLGKNDDAVCGYESKGVADKDGEVLEGEESDVLHWRTSMDRNLIDHAYCDFLEDSPLTDENCTPNPDAPNWDYRVVYEVWLRRDAFDPQGFGTAHMTFVHASPAKGGENTVEIVRQDCPCPTQEHECRDFPGPNSVTNNNGANIVPEPTGKPGDPCEVDDDCASRSFCYQGTCLSVIL